MKKYFIFFVLFLIAGCVGLKSFDENDLENYSSNAETDKNVILTFFNAGQGDSILVESNGRAILIDAGNDWLAPVLYEHMRSYNINLEYVLITHYHTDHLGGLFPMVAGPDGELNTADDLWPANGFLDRGSENAEESLAYQEYTSLSDGRRKQVQSGDIYRIGDSTVEIMATNYENKYKERIDFDKFDENSAGIVTLVKLNNFKCLLTGDITGGGGKEPYLTANVESLIAEDVGKVDCLKVAHHGSSTSTNQFFVDDILPEVSIISVGNDNGYGHPSKEVVKRLIESGSRVIATQTGEISDVEHEVADSNIVVIGDENGLLDVVY